MRAEIEKSVAVLSLVSLALTFGAGQVAAAEEMVIVVPNEFADAEGPSSVGPDAPQGPFRFQQIFAASEFAALAQSEHLLTRFAWRPNMTVDGPRTVSLDTEIRFSTTNRDHEHLSWTYKENVGWDETIVYSGPLTIHSENKRPASGPREFDYVVELQTPFRYNPSEGNLLMDMTSHLGITSADYPNQDFVYDCSPSTCFVVGNPSSKDAGAEFGGMVTQFTFLVACDYSLMGDLNDDCRVDFEDLEIMCAHWPVDCATTPANAACAPKSDIRNGYFTDVKPVPGLDSPYRDQGPSISADGLTIYFTSDRGGGQGDGDIWMSTRPTVADSWGAPNNLGTPINTPAWDGMPHISADDLTLYFNSRRDGGNNDLYEAMRSSTSDPFGDPCNLGSGVNSPDIEHSPSVSADGLTLYFTSDRSGGAGGRDLYVATRNSTSQPFGPAQILANVNTSAHDKNSSTSSDGLTLFFDSTRPGNIGPSEYEELWVATRNSTDEDFGTPVNLNDFGLGSVVNVATAVEFTPCISHDWPANGSKLYFGHATEESDWDLYEATWVVPCEYDLAGDLNDDCRVDFLDIATLAANWLVDCSATPENPACVPK